MFAILEAHKEELGSYKLLLMFQPYLYPKISKSKG